MVKLENTDIGKLAYDLHSDLLCVIVEDLDRTVTDVLVNPDESLTVYDLYHECERGDEVYAVTYVEQFEDDDVLYMDRLERYDFAQVSDCDMIYIPSPQLSMRD
jgi:hypothetical protein